MRVLFIKLLGGKKGDILGMTRWVFRVSSARALTVVAIQLGDHGVLVMGAVTSTNMMSRQRPTPKVKLSAVGVLTPPLDLVANTFVVTSSKGAYRAPTGIRISSILIRFGSIR